MSPAGRGEQHRLQGPLPLLLMNGFREAVERGRLIAREGDSHQDEREVGPAVNRERPAFGDQARQEKEDQELGRDPGGLGQHPHSVA